MQREPWRVPDWTGGWAAAGGDGQIRWHGGSPFATGVRDGRTTQCAVVLTNADGDAAGGDKKKDNSIRMQQDKKM